VDPLISDLVERYEHGRLSRRDLVAGLSALAAAGAAPAIAQPAAPPALKPTGIDHVSILAADVQRSTDFYGRVFGLTLVNEDKANKIARLGAGGKVLVSLRIEPPPGVIDHFAIGVEGFNRDAVTADLKGFGLTPADNIQFGFHVKDPDGAVVQITGV